MNKPNKYGKVLIDSQHNYDRVGNPCSDILSLSLASHDASVLSSKICVMNSSICVAPCCAFFKHILRTGPNWTVILCCQMFPVTLAPRCLRELVILRICNPFSLYRYYVGHSIRPSGAINIITDKRGPLLWEQRRVNVMIVEPDATKSEGVSPFVLW